MQCQGTGPTFSINNFSAKNAMYKGRLDSFIQQFLLVLLQTSPVSNTINFFRCAHYVSPA